MNGTSLGVSDGAVEMCVGMSVTPTAARCAATFGDWENQEDWVGRLLVAGSQDHERMVFRTPAGMGARVALRIRVGNQPMTTPYYFAYDPAVVSVVMPNRLDAEGGPLELRGINFGSRRSPVRIALDADDCESPEWAQDSYNEPFLRCARTKRTTVGAHALNLTVALQVSPRPPARAPAHHQSLRVH